MYAWYSVELKWKRKSFKDLFMGLSCAACLSHTTVKSVNLIILFSQ